jgi:uncharacterized membrane protein YfhO
VESGAELHGNGGVEPAHISEYAPDKVAVDVNARADALLMLNDCFTPGWNAYLDGAKVPIIATDYLFRGVSVGAGKHTVVFRYEPVSFYFGLLWFAAGVIGAFVWALVGKSRLK